MDPDFSIFESRPLLLATTSLILEVFFHFYGGGEGKTNLKLLPIFCILLLLLPIAYSFT